MKPAKSGHIVQKNQSGIALIFVLLILVIVSLLGVGGAQLALMGERGARNERDTQIAKQFAEAALTDAEFDMKGGYTTSQRPYATVFNAEMNFIEGCGTSGSSKGLCAQSLSGKPIWLTVNFLDDTENAPFIKLGEITGRADGLTYSNGIQPALAPRYIVEVLPDSTASIERGLKVKKKILHRVTAMGFGPNKNTATVLQMVYRKE